MSLSSRLRTAVALPRAERALALRAILTLVRVRVTMRLFGFPRVKQWVDDTSARRGRAPGSAHDVRRAMERAARTVPGSTCLPRAIAATRLLREAGLPAEFTIGVAATTTLDAAVAAESPPLDAHAWVQSGDVIVTGDVELDRYVELTRSDASA